MRPEDKVLQSLYVRHTGTFFFWRLAHAARLLFGGRHWETDPEVGAPLLGPQYLTILTIRHPFDVAVSWLNRDEPLADLGVQLNELAARYVPDRHHWFRCDTAQRDAEIAALQAFVDRAHALQAPPRTPLGLASVVDWSVDPTWTTDARGWKARRAEAGALLVPLLSEQAVATLATLYEGLD